MTRGCVEHGDDPNQVLTYFFSIPQLYGELQTNAILAGRSGRYLKTIRVSPPMRAVLNACLVEVLLQRGKFPDGLTVDSWNFGSGPVAIETDDMVLEREIWLRIESR